MFKGCCPSSVINENWIWDLVSVKDSVLPDAFKLNLPVKMGSTLNSINMQFRGLGLKKTEECNRCWVVLVLLISDDTDTLLILCSMLIHCINKNSMSLSA